MNRIMEQIGEYREIDIVDKDGTVKTARCLEACEDQQNKVSITSSRLPNRHTMLEWSDFCTVIQKLRKSCNHRWKLTNLNKEYPLLCPLLLAKLKEYEGMSTVINKTNLCEKVIENFSILNELQEVVNGTYNSTDETLISEIHRYARQNFALINVYIKPPVVTKITKDERVPVIWFVANCGGILGLCMGFSIVTVFEVLHYFCCLLYHTCWYICCSRNQSSRSI